MIITEVLSALGKLIWENRVKFCCMIQLLDLLNIMGQLCAPGKGLSSSGNGCGQEEWENF